LAATAQVALSGPAGPSLTAELVLGGGSITAKTLETSDISARRGLSPGEVAISPNSRHPDFKLENIGCTHVQRNVSTLHCTQVQ